MTLRHTARRKVVTAAKLSAVQNIENDHGRPLPAGVRSTVDETGCS